MNKELREMLEMINNKKAEARELVNSNNIEEAKVMKNEIQELQNKFDLMKDLFEEEIEGVDNMIEISDKKKDNKDAKVIAFNKAVQGKPLTKVENNLVERVAEDGGYLVPVEQQNTIKELKRNLKPLKDYCNVIPVGSLSGTMPLEVEANDKLIKFNEMTDINQSSIKFGQVKYEVEEYGDIIPISNSLLADEKANLTTYVGKRFAKKAVRSENEEILAIVKTAKQVAKSNNHKIIAEALNMHLDTAIADSAIILTNKTGYNYLDMLEDANGKPLLTEDVSKPGAKFYKGKEIVRVNDSELENRVEQVSDEHEGTVDKVVGIPFYIGDISEMVTFFDRESLEMAVSTEAGFFKNATMMRVIERFDTKAVDTDAMVKVEIAVV